MFYTLVAIAALAVTGFVIWRANHTWFSSHREYRRNLRAVEALDTICNAADQKHMHGADAPEVDVQSALRELKQLAQGCPAAVMKDIEEIEKRWTAINLQVKGKEDHAVATTLESSLITTRTARLSREIHELAMHVEQQLRDPNRS